MVIGYMWCIIGYILLNMVQRQFTKHMSGIYRTRTFIPEETERNGGYLAFFLQMIWFILIAIDLMIFLFQRLQKQSLRSLPLIGGNGLILSFLYSPEVSFQMWKSGISNVGLRIRSVFNLIDADEKIHQLWVSILFLTCALVWSNIPAGSTPDGRRKQGW